MEVKISFVIQRDDEDIELWIFGDAEPYTPPNFRGHPDNWAPGDGGCACVEAIFLDEDGTQRWDGKLTSKEESEAEQQLMYQLEDDLRDSAEAAAEAKAEAMMDSYYDDYGPYGRDIYD